MINGYPDETLNDYQEKVGETAVYPGTNTQAGFNYVLLGLVGEAGEIANKFKKILRSHGESGETYYTKREVLMDELGDVLWYAAQLATELGYTLEEVAHFNVVKLAKRKAEGTLKNRPEETIVRLSEGTLRTGETWGYDEFGVWVQLG